jgi:hypothetical protein
LPFSSARALEPGIARTLRLSLEIISAFPLPSKVLALETGRRSLNQAETRSPPRDRLLPFLNARASERSGIQKRREKI